MLLHRVFGSQTSSALARLVLAPSSCRYIACASYTTVSHIFSSTSSSTDDQKRQHRYLQTVTAHRPLNLIEAGAPPPRNADAPLSSLTGHNVFNVPSQATMRPSVTPSPQSQSKNAASSLVKTPQEPTSAPRPSRLRTPRKAAMTLTSSAISQLRKLLDSPDPKLIRVGVKNRGCSGLAYHLEYVDKPGKFDEEVVQDGVRVLIDSKALFSIIGSEMDWVEDKLSARFVFKNPNIKEQCGCGESFSVGN